MSEPNYSGDESPPAVSRAEFDLLLQQCQRLQTQLDQSRQGIPKAWLDRRVQFDGETDRDARFLLSTVERLAEQHNVSPDVKCEMLRHACVGAARRRSANCKIG